LASIRTIALLVFPTSEASASEAAADCEAVTVFVVAALVALCWCVVEPPQAAMAIALNTATGNAEPPLGPATHRGAV
jgi:hypothetical protein